MQQYYRLPGILALLVISFIASCDTSENPATPPGDSFMATAPIERLALAEQDRISHSASYLALRDMHLDSLRRDTEIAIDPDLTAMYRNALAHVYLSGLAAADSVRLIRAFPRPAAESLMFDVGATVPWFQRLEQGEPTTGYAEFDALLSEWKLTVWNIHDWMNDGKLVVLQTATLCNMQALAVRFRTLSDIGYAEPNSTFGDGPDITGVRHDAGVTLRFTVAWGDCPSGCISRHTWTFDVSRNGVVELRSITGQNLPG